MPRILKKTLSGIPLIAALFTFLSFSAYPLEEGNRVEETTTRLYQSIDFDDASKPDYDLFLRTMVGFYQLKHQGKLSDKNIITIIDFRKSANEKRLWTIDLKNKKILYHSLVAHGRNSGELYASKFSNTPNSNQSSLGFYVTGKTYTGKHGISLKLQGVERGINDLAESRAVVMHGAEYVTESFVKNVGRLGRSFGCPAVPMNIHKEIIPKLAEGTCLFIYYPEKGYLTKTQFYNLNEAAVYLEEYLAAE
jgi:hypothetical protein